eukprot:1151831-Prorocentrum_lima.AAC.1
MCIRDSSTSALALKGVCSLIARLIALLVHGATLQYCSLAKAAQKVDLAELEGKGFPQARKWTAWGYCC